MTEGRQRWRRAPADLVERFHAAVAGVEGLEVRSMFGYPAGFVGGNMAVGLHQETFFVRLSEEDRRARLDDGWTRFGPMPGRPLREYLVLPEDVAADAEACRPWVERAATYVRTLPPKRPKAKAPRG